jgi:hypothetical protein
LTSKGTQDPGDDRLSKFLKGSSPEQNKIINNYINEKLASPEFADFVKEKLGLESIQDLYQIEDMDKFVNEELGVYLSEFLVPRFEPNVEEIDYDEIENQHKIFKENLLAYFNELTNVSIEEITMLTPEELYTLKQFLKDIYLSARDMEMLLIETDFKAAYKNVNKKITRLHNLGFIKEVHPTGGGYISKFDGRSQYYKLTSCGLFCVLKEIQEEDIGDPFRDMGIKIFEVYQDDPLLQLFLHDLIDKNLLSETKDFLIKRIFINYLKQVCQEIYKELVVYARFLKNGIGVGSGVKWNRNLENKKEEWNRFFDNLLGNVIFVPAIDNKISRLSELVVNPDISKYSCSFYYDNRKYSIDIDTQNRSAKLRINDNEYIKVYDTEKGKAARKYGEIDIQIEPHCFILKRLSREPEDYLLSLTRRFLIPIDLLKTQLGYSILQLFYEKDSIYALFPTSDDKKYLDELRKLALDTKVKRLIDDFYNKVNRHYDGFAKYGE